MDAYNNTRKNDEYLKVLCRSDTIRKIRANSQILGKNVERKKEKENGSENGFLNDNSLIRILCFDSQEALSVPTATI